MTLEEREKEMMENFAKLDEKQKEKKECMERWRKAGAEVDSMDEAQLERLAGWDRIIREHSLTVANKIWDIAWAMMEEGYGKSEEDIAAFAAAHPELRE